MDIAFAYRLEKSVIYKNYLRKKLHPISMAIGHLHKILLLKIPKGNMKARRF
jgi:hypothetical protein